MTRYCEQIYDGKAPKHKQKKLLEQTSLMGYFPINLPVQKIHSLLEMNMKNKNLNFYNPEDPVSHKAEGSSIKEDNNKAEESWRKVRKHQLPESKDEECDESEIENVESDQTKYTNPQFVKLKDNIIDALALLLSKIKVDSAVSVPSNTSVQGDNENYSELGLSKADILLCKDFRTLHTLLLEKGNFTVDLENDVIVCRLCCESSQLYFLKQPGIININILDYDAESETKAHQTQKK